MMWLLIGLFIGSVISLMLYSSIAAERINELEAANSRLIDDLNKAEYEARKYKYTYKRWVNERVWIFKWWIKLNGFLKDYSVSMNLLGV